MDVGEWLYGVGLDQYEPLFRQNDLDLDVLADLTEADFDRLGVTLGARKRLMKAIAALAPASPPRVDLAERRQLTVMFCDLVGSTALSARPDPEDMRQAIRAFQDAFSGVVARYDGFVAKFMGDGILAYFGFPRAHEDDDHLRRPVGGLPEAGVAQRAAGVTHWCAGLRSGAAASRARAGALRPRARRRPDLSLRPGRRSGGDVLSRHDALAARRA